MECERLTCFSPKTIQVRKKDDGDPLSSPAWPGNKSSNMAVDEVVSECETLKMTQLSGENQLQDRLTCAPRQSSAW